MEEGLQVSDQKQEGTCYAHATAAAIYLATRRIYGRRGGYPKFKDLLDEIILEFGRDGGHTEKVLATVAPKYRLHCKELAGEEQARAALHRQRPVVATFSLSGKKKTKVESNGEDQWAKFSQFFKKNPYEVLKSKDIGNYDIGERSGHAVVLVGCLPNALVFKNSWGTVFADEGYFRVENGGVLGGVKFHDVFFLESDLYPEEVQAYKGHEPMRLHELLEWPIYCDMELRVREIMVHMDRALEALFLVGEHSSGRTGKVNFTPDIIKRSKNIYLFITNAMKQD